MAQAEDNAEQLTTQHVALDNVDLALARFTEHLGDQLATQFGKMAETVKQDVRQQTHQAVMHLEKRLEKVESRLAPAPAVSQANTSTEDFAKNDHAVALFYANDLESSAQLLEECTTENPDAVAPWSNLGAVYTAMGNRDKAVQAYRKAAEIAPDALELLNNRGVLALMNRDLDNAISLFRTAHQINPKHISVLLNLAQAFQALGHYARAVKAWKMVLAIDPHHEEAGQQLRQFYQ